MSVRGKPTGRKRKAQTKLPENQDTREKDPPGGHVFLPIESIFEPNCHIQETNILTNFHEYWAKNVSSRLFTCFHYIHIEKTAPPPGGHVFPPIMTIFELVRDIYKIDAKNVTSRENDPPSWRPCFFLPIRTIFKLNRHIQKTHVLTKFHEDWTKNVTSKVFTCFYYGHIQKTAPPPGGHVFSPICTIFEPVRDINETNVLTKFHNDWAKMFLYSHIMNTAPPPGGHYYEDWASNVNFTVFTSFQLNRTINLASRVFTRQSVYDARRSKGGHKSSP
ncbi:hypothetical protein DPMN_001320 [Dreissena polymorpha]|uniref:Uncharacterized protein n=1 Tax=Dreissena polymorpha TaxID=45954 RepID=A0A9D4RSQ5_DREPO|nr:hypothetical protein DPMN_001320 [Dreissena polymorpha]